MDTGYVELIKIIKKISKQENIVSLGTMKSPTTVDKGGLILDKEDLYINDKLTNLKSGDTVLLLKINEEQYAIVERVSKL